MVLVLCFGSDVQHVTEGPHKYSQLQHVYVMCGCELMAAVSNQQLIDPHINNVFIHECRSGLGK